MNNNFIKIINLSLGLFFFLSCSTMMEPEGDATAKPMIEKIEKYKNKTGHYPESLMKLIPEYLGQYDFQAFIYKYNRAQGQKLDEYIKKGLITQGKNEGYVLTVRFQRYKAECTYINGLRQSCVYIGR